MVELGELDIKIWKTSIFVEIGLYMTIPIHKPFLRKHHNYGDKNEFPDFNEFTLNMIFAIFLKISISIMAFFIKS